MMDLERINIRIKELENIEKEMNVLSSQKRLELASKEAEARELRKIITDNDFMGTDEFKELQELKITKKWIEIYNGNEPMENEENIER